MVKSLCVRSCGNWYILSLVYWNQGGHLTRTIHHIVLDRKNGIYKRGVRGFDKNNYYFLKYWPRDHWSRLLRSDPWNDLLRNGKSRSQGIRTYFVGHYDIIDPWSHLLMNDELYLVTRTSPMRTLFEPTEQILESPSYLNVPRQDF